MRNRLYELYADLDKSSELCSSGGVVTVHSPSLLKHSGITHGFSTRIGGVCLPPFDSLNFSQKRNDSPDNIRRNYRILSESRGFNPDRLVIINHEHGNKVLRVDGKDAGKGLFGNMLPFGDGLITNDPSITLMGCHAD
ncbi:MAG: laccase domain-containing protein, partial [Clostridium sp.]|nr:laccase domain-containing protein [Clostridium sp.]